MKYLNFDPFHPILIIEFMCNLNKVYDTSGIHVRAGLLLFPFFMQKSAPTVLHMQLTSKHNACRVVASAKKTFTFTENLKIANYFLLTYANGDNIADTNEKMTTFFQSPNKTLSQYANELVAKTIRCGDFSEDQY